MADDTHFKINSTPYPGSNAIAVDLIAIILLGGLAVYLFGVVSGGVLTLVIIAIVLSLSVRTISEWNRMAVLRFGKYKGIVGPGLRFIMPVLERTPITVDLRVISTTFSAEKTLTKDNVPVDVDAILFWQVYDPEKAVLDVQIYKDSVQLASQTAMRDVIGKNELSLMLAGRDAIGDEIKQLIQERVASWGVTAISVELRDVTIPQELQNAMAKVATSDREKQARVILAESESLAADKMLEAAQKYQQDPFAMQLRSLNMMYEISLTGKNLMVFIPTESKGFSIPTPIGVVGLEEIAKMNQSLSQVIQKPDETQKQKKKGPQQ